MHLLVVKKASGNETQKFQRMPEKVLKITANEKMLFNMSARFMFTRR